MEYIFGTEGSAEVLKIKGNRHTNLTGYHQIEQKWPDQTITDHFRVAAKIRSAEDSAGACYDWYEIDHHYRVVDRTGPLQAQIAQAAVANEQVQITAKLYAQANAKSLSDAVALTIPDMFRHWEDALAAGEPVEENDILWDENQLYRVAQPGGVTPQANQPPHADGMLAVYRPIVLGHAGTLEDPIPFISGMDTEKDKYYSYNDKIYLCNLAMSPCTWAPDSPGLWQWTLVT